jgi:CTP:molybdopterin cytidylyltransferase MocA
LQGDRGASAVIDWQSADLIPCDDPSILTDIDYPSDLPLKD